MRITGIETLRLTALPNLCWVRLDTDEGVTGLGEAFRNSEATTAYIHETLAPYLLGRDPRTVNAHREAISRVIGNRFMGTPSRSVELRGNSAIDVALWDIRGKSLGVSLVDLLGGPARERIRAYNTCAGYGYNTAVRADWQSDYVRPGQTRQTADPSRPYEDLDAQVERPAELARSLAEMGFEAMKVWPFDAAAKDTGGNSIAAADLKAALQTVEGIREACGHEMDIMLEFHGLWRLPAAVTIGKALEDYGLFWSEDPIEMHRLDDLKRYRDRVALPVAGSENHGSAFWYKDAFAAGLIDYAHFDLGWTGGISDGLDVAALARAYDRAIAPHDCVGPVQFVANLHLAISQPKAVLQEMVRAYYWGYYRDIVTQLPPFEAGYLSLPDGAGLGVELLPDLDRRADAIVRRSANN